jgi:pilus assembly protein CpaB
MKPARIIVLLIAVVAGGIAALLAGRWESPPPAPAPTVQLETTEVLVAAVDIGLGSSIAAEDMRWQTWPAASANSNFVRKTDRPDAIAQLAGSITRASFVTGEPIREAKLIKAKGSGYLAAILPSGMRAISVEISPENSAAGFILPNDHVDVILTRRDPVAEAAFHTNIALYRAELILSNVLVLAIDQTIEEKYGKRVVIGKTATLQLDAREATALARARQAGLISLALRSLADSEKDPLDDGSEAKKGINVVRFGFTAPVEVK